MKSGGKHRGLLQFAQHSKGRCSLWPRWEGLCELVRAEWHRPSATVQLQRAAARHRHPKDDFTSPPWPPWGQKARKGSPTRLSAWPVSRRGENAEHWCHRTMGWLDGCCRQPIPSEVCRRLPPPPTAATACLPSGTRPPASAAPSWATFTWSPPRRWRCLMRRDGSSARR